MTTLGRRAAPRPVRALPPDPSIAELSTDERTIAAAIWLGRSEAEARASGSFAVIAQALTEAGASAELIAIARRAITDEQNHARICAEVAAAYAPEPLRARRELPITVPVHADAEPALRRALHVVGQCCVNETTGSAFLELCRERARAPLAAAALHQLLADEIDHARIGWAFLAGAEPSVRTALAARLPALLAANLRAWRDRPRYARSNDRPARLAEHGCPTWEDVDAAVVAAMRTLLVPGFAHVGVDTSAAEAWLTRIDTDAA